MLFAYLRPDWMNWASDATYTVAFFLPFAIGFGMSFIVMGVVNSAVDTVIVCFAEAPGDFESNHPEHSRRMVETWRNVHPGAFGVQ